MTRVRVGIVFGGRSGEHEVSLASARSILGALDPAKYDPVPIGITREGHWLIAESPEALLQAEVTPNLPDTEEAIADPSHHAIVRSQQGNAMALHESAIDVVFPVLHGPNGEDGSIQGLLQTAGIPYVGSEVLGSALGMDKWRMKAIFAQWGIPNVPYRGFPISEWERDRHGLLAEIEERLRYPMFVKPSNMGSSVGISKVRNREELECGIDRAAVYDRTVVVEEGIDGREVEVGVLGNDDPLVSVVGEIKPHHDFYDYEAKYTQGLADLIIPARLSPDQVRDIGRYATSAFRAVDAAGLARVDFFVRKDDGSVVINEINTMPGFTATSMYPRLWEATGVPYASLIDRLIELAVERYETNSRRRVRL